MSGRVVFPEMLMCIYPHENKDSFFRYAKYLRALLQADENTGYVSGIQTDVRAIRTVS
jgi:hypothetical protein